MTRGYIDEDAKNRRIGAPLEPRAGNILLVYCHAAPPSYQHVVVNIKKKGKKKKGQRGEREMIITCAHHTALYTS